MLIRSGRVVFGDWEQGVGAVVVERIDGRSCNDGRRMDDSRMSLVIVAAMTMWKVKKTVSEDQVGTVFDFCRLSLENYIMVINLVHVDPGEGSVSQLSDMQDLLGYIYISRIAIFISGN